MNGLPFVKLFQTTLRHCASAMVMLGAISLSAQAQTPEWAPTKPVRIIVPIVGSTNDVLARLLAPKLSEVLGQPVLVENKPGAGGNLGADMVAKAAPDGHTLLIGYNGPMAINVSLFDKMPYDPVKDLAPITLVDISLWFVTLKALSALVLGGFGSIPGAIVGGLLIGLIEQYAGVYMPDGTKDIVAYLVLIAVLIVRPHGLLGEAHGRRV